MVSAKHKLLVIDDSHADALALTGILCADRKDGGPSVTHRPNAATGYEALDQERYDCVFLDYELGPDNGLEILREIRSRSDIPVIMLTGSGDESVAVRALKGGAQDYITKDALDRRTVTSALRRAVGAVKLQRELAEQRQELEEFTQVVAHDLKAPIRQIRMLSTEILEELAERGSLADDELIQLIGTSARRMEELIAGLLEFTRVGRSGQPLVPVDLQELVEGLLMDHHHRIKEIGAEVNVDPLPVVRGEGTGLRQLFQNLLENGIKFRSEHPLQLTITARVNGAFVEVAVRDNGIGFDEKHSRAIFEPFKRFSNDPHIEGSGIGLATCQRVVKHHRGRIWATSAPGEGSAIHFTLPLHHGGSSDDDTPSPFPMVGGPGSDE